MEELEFKEEGYLIFNDEMVKERLRFLRQYPVTAHEAFGSNIQDDWVHLDVNENNDEFERNKRQSPEDGFKSLAQAWLPGNS